MAGRIWANMSKVPSSGGYVKDRLPDHFVGDIRVTRCYEKWIRARGDVNDHTRPADAFIVEFKIETTNLPDVCPEGATKSHYQQLGGKFPDLFVSAVKEFMCAALGIDPLNSADVDERFNPRAGEYVDLAVGPDNGLADVLVHVETSPYKNADGEARTLLRWSPVSADEVT